MVGHGVGELGAVMSLATGVLGGGKCVPGRWGTGRRWGYHIGLGITGGCTAMPIAGGVGSLCLPGGARWAG